MRRPAAPPAASRAVLPFVAAHFCRLFGLLFLLLGGGLLRALWRRQLCGRAALAGAALLAACLWGLELGVCRGGLFEARRSFYLALAAVGLAVGWLHGTLGRRLGFWESYGVCLLGTLGAGLRIHTSLAAPWGAPADAFFAAPAAAGAAWLQLLGPFWDRLLVLCGLGVWVAALVGGSLAYLTTARGVGNDWGWRLEWTLARRAWSGQAPGGMAAVSAVAVVGVALGVASLVTVDAVMGGYQADIREKILATHAHLVVQKYGQDFDDAAAVARRALQVPGVVAATPFLFNELMLSAGSVGRGVLLKGIEPRSAAGVTGLHAQLCLPAALPGRCRHAAAADPAAATARLEAAFAAGAPGDLPPLVVGWELFVQLGRPLAGTVVLTAPVGLAGARGGLPVRQTFRLAGVFCGGMHEFDARLVYTALPAAQRLFGMQGRVSGVELRAQDPERVARLTAQLRPQVGRYPYRLNDWRELNAGLFAALGLQKTVMFLVLCCMVVVASFNIAATLFMAVVQKRQAIAVLQTMGARDASIMKVFVLQGMMVGLCGTALGLLLGCGMALLLQRLHIDIAADVYMVDALRVSLQAWDVGLVALASLTICHLSTLFPARQAAAHRPAAALRLENL